MSHYILVRETKVIEIIDDDLEILIIDLINNKYINIGKVWNINSAIVRLEELKRADKIMENHIANILDELDI